MTAPGVRCARQGFAHALSGSVLHHSQGHQDVYLRFTLSFRDVEELLAERDITVSHESIRRWVLTFGPAIAQRLRTSRPRPHGRWHLDEMVVRIGGQMYLWRAVDAEGEVLDVLLQAKRDTKAARKLMRKLLKKQGMGPDE